MPAETLLWIGFAVFVITMMALDLGVFHRSAHEVRFKEALGWSVTWISLAFIFNIGVYIWRGPQAAIEFTTAYLIEESLSVDNLFVFLLIFNYFRVPRRFQHSVLFWGIVGVLIMRGIFIALGISLIHHFEWVIYVFGGMLMVTGIKLAFEKDKEIEPEKNIILKLFRRIMPITDRCDNGEFFIRQDGRLFATPLMVVLIVVETTDVIFAVDSIPAVLAITTDPFIVYTSNIFAILGLRSLYFVLSNVLELFHHLHYGLSVILVFIGTKMLMSHFYKIPTGVSLLVIVITLAISIITSIVWPEAKKKDSAIS